MVIAQCLVVSHNSSVNGIRESLVGFPYFSHLLAPTFPAWLSARCVSIRSTGETQLYPLGVQLPISYMAPNIRSCLWGRCDGHKLAETTRTLHIYHILIMSRKNYIELHIASYKCRKAVVFGSQNTLLRRLLVSLEPHDRWHPQPGRAQNPGPAPVVGFGSDSGDLGGLPRLENRNWLDRFNSWKPQSKYIKIIQVEPAQGGGSFQQGMLYHRSEGQVLPIWAGVKPHIFSALVWTCFVFTLLHLFSLFPLQESFSICHVFSICLKSFQLLPPLFKSARSVSTFDLFNFCQLLTSLHTLLTSSQPYSTTFRIFATLSTSSQLFPLLFTFSQSFSSFQFFSLLVKFVSHWSILTVFPTSQPF